MKETAIRETFEETAIDLNKAEYLGMIDQRLFTMEAKDKKTQKVKKFHMGVMLFHLQSIPEIKLNFKEARDCKWVSLKIFFSGDVNKFGCKDKDFPANFVKYEIPAYIQRIQFPSMEIGMEVELLASPSSA